MKSFFIRPGKPAREVKNLGWLLRHWLEVTEFSFDYAPDSARMIDGKLIAKLKDGGKYETEFSSLSVCFNFLNRPVFRGLRLQINNLKDFMKIQFWIGNDDYRRANRMEHKEQIAYLTQYVSKN